MNDQLSTRDAFEPALERLTLHPGTKVLAAILRGAQRIQDLADATSLDQTTLGNVLRDLDDGGFVARQVDPGPPLRVFYELTERSFKLAGALEMLLDWAKRRV
jgi:DNA-binding HxlR family transcriptional regulator